MNIYEASMLDQQKAFNDFLADQQRKQNDPRSAYGFYPISYPDWVRGGNGETAVIDAEFHRIEEPAALLTSGEGGS